MEERKIVESVNSYQKTVLKTCIILLVLAVVSFGVCKICRNLCTEYFWNIDYSDPNYETLRQQGSMCDTIAEITSLISVVSLIADVVLWIFYWVISKMQIVVTDKRVYGKTSFGKQVDLPLDSISAVGTSVFKGIAVGTSSGRIKFLGISNRNEIYEEIKKILADRQTKEVKASAPVTNITQAQSSADELKKFKELLDSGIITQEEFDAKKKQLLGL